MRKVAFLALLLLSTQSFAMTYFLTKSWQKNGSTFCQYSNGTVLNIGVGVCAMSING